MSHIFDALEYTNGAEAVGIKREHAEYQAKQISRITNHLEIDLVTRDYLSKELLMMEQRLIIKMGMMMFVMGGLMVSILTFMLKN